MVQSTAKKSSAGVGRGLPQKHS
uniref:Uncharacterized protein n=1 Tax=Anguilla anguilla TaxID=7936 RepID=A0A0E9WA49_ANGAN